VSAPKHHAVAVFTREARFSRRVVLPSSGAECVPCIGASRGWLGRAGHTRLEIFLRVERIADPVIE